MISLSSRVRLLRDVFNLEQLNARAFRHFLEAFWVCESLFLDYDYLPRDPGRSRAVHDLSCQLHRESRCTALRRMLGHRQRVAQRKSDDMMLSRKLRDTLGFGLPLYQLGWRLVVRSAVKFSVP